MREGCVKLEKKNKDVTFKIKQKSQNLSKETKLTLSTTTNGDNKKTCRLILARRALAGRQKPGVKKDRGLYCLR